MNTMQLDIWTNTEEVKEREYQERERAEKVREAICKAATNISIPIIEIQDLKKYEEAIQKSQYTTEGATWIYNPIGSKWEAEQKYNRGEISEYDYLEYMHGGL